MKQKVEKLFKKSKPIKLIALMLVVTCILLALSTGSRQIFAQSGETSNHFHTSLTSTYTVDTGGNTRVEHAFRIRNLTPEYFINRYSMQLGTDSLKEIKVATGSEVIEADVKHGARGTLIDIEFPDRVVGKDKVKEFSISYLNPVMSEVNGQVLETFIPSMASEQPYNEHKVILVTPLQFGHPSRIKPEGYKIKQDGQTFVLTYDNLVDEGISAIFGSQQIFNLGIRYHLQNPHSQPAITQVSLPPDTPFQSVFYEMLEPKPQQIEIDPDGNWIATYHLPASDTVEVNIQAVALISLEEINPHLNVEPLKEHLSNQTYWETNHQEIVEAAAQNQDAFSIYQFVVGSLEYTHEDLSQGLDRMGAVNALRNPDLATCQEFTDLFVALARTNEIPARRATGYAHSNDPILQPISLVTDILHAWPEYYHAQEKRWIPIDPTWGSTMSGVDYFHQFDLKHIVFAYNGRSSRMPLAAGNYKLPDKESKDLEIEFGQELPEYDPQFEIALNPKKIFGLISLPSWYELIVTNNTGSAWYNNHLVITFNNDQIVADYNNQPFSILPWQNKRIGVQVFNSNHLLPKADEITIEITQEDDTFKETHQVKTVKPVTTNIANFITQFSDEQRQAFTINEEQLSLILGITASIFAVSAGGLLVYRRKKQSALRRQSEESQEESPELHQS